MFFNFDLNCLQFLNNPGHKWSHGFKDLLSLLGKNKHLALVDYFLHGRLFYIKTL
ncbi:hypothetical protein D3C71_2165890 [compost metagenome]